MINGNKTSQTSDDMLDEVAAAYLEALEQGHAPNTQEWLARYPELASELASFFADQDKVNRWTAPLREAALPAQTPVHRTPSTLDYHKRPLQPPPVGSFGDYFLLQEISRGGMGIIYLARQVSLDRMVAVKMILSGQLAAPAEVQRFYAEAVAAAHLDHPNIVPVYEVGEVAGQCFYSMKIMEGGSLSKRVAELRGRPRAATALICKVAHAVHHAHQRGILHRDLKPDNVLLDAADEPHVSDFGLSQRLADSPHSGAVVGTPSYMAPEQAAGEKRLTTAVDIYSVGAILYALLTGGPPFRAPTRLETLHLVIAQAPPRPRTLNPLVDRDLETICLKCLDKSPRQRYASAQALAEDLQRYLAGEPIQARPTPLWVRVLKWAKRRPALAALMVVSLAAALSLCAGYLLDQERRVALAEQALNERRRSDSLRRDIQNLVLQGQRAMSLAQWSEAKVHLASARRLLATESALVDLEAPVAHFLDETERRLRQETARREAESQYRNFVELRAQALFQGTVFPGADLLAHGTNMRAPVQQALASFGVEIESTAGPLFTKPFTPEEKQAIHEGCYELLMMLAESVAREHPRHLPQALRILQRAEPLGQRTQAYHLQRARYLKQLGDETGARKESDQAATLLPVSVLDYFLLGEDRHRQGQFPQAIRAFQSTLQLQPDHFWARYLLAVCYLRLQPARADLACDNLTACLGQRREVPWVYLLRAVCHGQLERYQAAEDDFQKALKHQANEDLRAAILVNRGALLSRQQKFAQAVADLQQALRLKPNQYQAYANLAKVHQQQQQFAAAVAQLDRAVATAVVLVKAAQLERSALALLYRHRAQLQLDCQNPKAALADFRQALATDPCAADHAACGRLLQGLGRFPEALQAYTAALQADAEHGDAHLGRAEMLFKLENYPEALGALEHYLKKPRPGTGPKVLADVYRAHGLTRVKLGRYAEGLADFTLALNLQADSVTHSYRGWAYLVSKAPQLALADFDKAIQLDKDNSDAYLGRATVRIKLGVKLHHYQEAIADAEAALRCGPNQDARRLWNAARIYAQAASKLEAERTGQSLKFATQYRDQALQRLRESLKWTPAAERVGFWRTYIQNDPDLSRFAAVLSPG